MGNQNTIQVKGLHRTYGSQVAVNNLNLELNKGEILALLGVNGAGKSSTLNMLAGVDRSDQGKITISDYSLSDYPLKARACLGYLPEQPPLYPDMKVDQYLAFCGQLRLLSKAELPPACERVKQRCGLQEHGKRVIKHLSKGYQQRVGIAQAIIHQPDLILLDEPTVGLDPVQIVEIRQLIRELGDQHSVILSTHLLPEVLSICDRVMILRSGQIVHQAPVSRFTEGESLEQLFIRLTCGDEALEKSL